MTRAACLSLAVLAGGLAGCGPEPAGPADSVTAVRYELRDPAQLDRSSIGRAQGAGVQGIVLCLGERGVSASDRRAADDVRAAGLELGYWLEVGRSVTLAERRPDLMASLQGHDEWRRTLADAPVPGEGEVVKTWPWIPVGYPQAFDLHLARITDQLARLPAADVVYLNDLQGPPSACGCGNPLCRWATDYTLGSAEPLRSAAPSGPDAAARFVAAVRQIAGSARVVPVWVTECEQADRQGPCAGVGCYHGACWREFDRQWSALVRECPTVALLLPHASFDRRASWPRSAVEHLRRRAGDGVELIAVVEDGADPVPGLDVLLIGDAQVPQGFEPRLLRVE